MKNQLSELALQVQQEFIARHYTLSCAESCSGGLLSSLFTEHSGASDYFKAGLITYSNFAKSKFLDLSPELILKEDAVSHVVAKLMAEKCKSICQTDVAISITGIAGPKGDEQTNDVGLVYIGLSYKAIAEVERFHFEGDREAIRVQSCHAALNVILKNIRDY